MNMLGALALAVALQEATDAKSELAKAVKNAADAASYAFTMTMETEGSWGPSRGPQTSEGAYQKDVGLSLKSDDSEAYKVGDDVVYKDESGEWKKVAREEPRREDGGERRGGGGRGGDRGGDWRRFRFRWISPPHESLSGIEGKFKEIKTSAEKLGDAECVVFSGSLTEDAIKDMGRRGGGRGDRQLSDAIYDGSAKIWVDDAYRIRKAVIETSVTGAMGERPFMMSMSRTIEFSKMGEAKVEVPEAAKKALEAKSAGNEDH